MDAGRAFQLREQVVRRHRLVMAICALALLVFACVVIAMVLKYELNKTDSAEGKENDQYDIQYPLTSIHAHNGSTSRPVLCWRYRFTC